MSKTILPLSSKYDRNIYFNANSLISDIQELELFLDGDNFMKKNNFSKKILLSREVKANNSVEGFNDDVSLVYDILYNHLNISDKVKMQRIKNLFKGYQYIFKESEINKDNLKKLYSILSNKLISNEDLQEMGDYYRLNPVYIFYSSYAHVEPDIGFDEKKLDYYMNELLEYINSNNDLGSFTDYFLKSQIVHFQLVNIHPYYDLNGRTSRTLAMWYLLNNQIHPYIIFNRAVSLNKEKYYGVIKSARDFGNVTYFLQYMLDKVKIELEKEYIINMIKESVGNLTLTDYQTIYYILSMKGLLSTKDFMSFYNRYNDKKRCETVIREMIDPLLDKGIINFVRETNSNINKQQKNFIFELNKSNYEIDPKKIKKLELV